MLKLWALKRSLNNNIEKRAENKTPGKVNTQEKEKLVKEQSMWGQKVVWEDPRKLGTTEEEGGRRV